MEELNFNNCRIIELPKIGNEEIGFLSFGEGQRHIPFEIKRIYYIYGIDNLNVIRGKHAHKKLEQVIFCFNGRFTLELDDGTNKKEIILDQPNIGIFIGNMIWRNMKNFSKNCVIVVLASDYHKEEDYIRDYEEFLHYARSHKNS